MKVSDYFRAIGPISPTEISGGASHVPTPLKGSGPSEFQKLLERQVTLSSHAQTRIESRSLPWDAEMEKRIGRGIDAAEQKGSREALILADNLAVIANVKSRTVVTAIDRSQMKEQVFTNIDSAVLV
ncbi:MAG: hypothetical protein HYR96_03570 [Deltaproteobacteria bacterium]|nr:hypothetical protein [Deltaproteobacteria bacterium]MBI3295196.1 hypothetical protein [Deltaproteobacteria bacterium]